MKDTVTNICGVVISVGGGVLAAHVSGQITLPETVVTVLGLAVAIATGIVAYFTGKQPVK